MTQRSRARSAHIAVLVAAARLSQRRKLISIEGDPESPISQGNLCPKGQRRTIAHTFAA